MIVDKETGAITFTLKGAIGTATVKLQEISGVSLHGRSALIFNRRSNGLDVELTKPEAARLLRLMASELEQEELKAAEDAITADDIASAPFA